jgi:hypothetical protein
VSEAGQVDHDLRLARPEDSVHAPAQVDRGYRVELARDRDEPRRLVEPLVV